MIIKNAKDALSINLKVGDKNITQFIHPSVIDFKVEHNIESWGGYRYWMVMTPFPYNDDKYENPTLCASNDGIHWESPKGITNPLDIAAGGLENGFHSDPEMVYNPDTDELWIYYRFLTIDRYQLKLLPIASNLIVNSPKIIMNQSPWNKHFELKSMAIVRESSDKWHMWGGSRSGYDSLNNSDPNNTLYLFSTDGIHWLEPRFCYNKEGIDPYYAIGYSNWHTACKYNPYMNKVDFLCFCNNRNNMGESGKIIYSSCTLDNPCLLSSPEDAVILGKSKNGWDSWGIYRCSFVIEPKENMLIYHIWYSGASSGTFIRKIGRVFLLGVKKYIRIFSKLVNLVPLSMYELMWHIGYTTGVIYLNYDEESLNKKNNEH